ncbi:hypothetical protein ES705_47899 [subsurface metagenome]
MGIFCDDAGMIDNKDRHPVGTFEKWLDCMVLKNKSVNKDIVLEFLKKWYVGMIAQALDGEYPNEFFLTLISTEQGIAKELYTPKGIADLSKGTFPEFQ